MKRKNPLGSNSHPGLLITLEGIEGCGKTTQWLKLSKFLKKKGFPVMATREPGGTPLAEEIRTLLLRNSGDPITPIGEALLVCASRVQHITKKINPALKEGTIVLCDRFSDSTMAYQGYARGLNLRTLQNVDRFSTDGLTPDLTLLFDVSVTIGLQRRNTHAKKQDRLDRESRKFHQKVRTGFLALAKKYPRRIKIIDGARSPEIIFAEVVNMVLNSITKRRNRGKRRQLHVRTRRTSSSFR